MKTKLNLDYIFIILSMTALFRAVSYHFSIGDIDRSQLYMLYALFFLIAGRNGGRDE